MWRYFTLECTHLVIKWGREYLTTKRVQTMLLGNSSTGDFAFPRNKKNNLYFNRKNVKTISRLLQVNKLWEEKIIWEGKP